MPVGEGGPVTGADVAEPVEAVVVACKPGAVVGGAFTVTGAGVTVSFLTTVEATGATATGACAGPGAGAGSAGRGAA